MTRYKKEIFNINNHMLDCSYKELQDFRMKKEWMKTITANKLKSFYGIKYMIDFDNKTITIAKYSRLYTHKIDDDFSVYLELKCEAHIVPRIAISISSKNMPDVVHTIHPTTSKRFKAILRYIHMICENNDISLEIWDANTYEHICDVSDIRDIEIKELL